MIAIIIVSYGRSELMEKTLKSLITNGLDKSQMTLTIIDNGSQQHTIDVLIKYHKYIDNLVLLNENKGKPYAWNLGARIVQEKCIVKNLKLPQYFLFCDNDILFKENWNIKLCTAYKEYKDLPLCGLSGMVWPTHMFTELKNNAIAKINIVRFPPGCCILMSVEAFKANGDWDTNKLIRTVDTSYFRKAFQRGYKNASIYPESVIEHTGRQQRSWAINNGKPRYIK